MEIDARLTNIAEILTQAVTNLLPQGSLTVDDTKRTMGTFRQALHDDLANVWPVNATGPKAVEPTFDAEDLMAIVVNVARHS